MTWSTIQDNCRIDRPNCQLSPRHLDYAQLETKLLLAGNVAVSLQGDHLTVTGDALGNEVVVTRDAQRTRSVRGNSKTINGSTQTLVATSSLRHLTIRLNGGDDQLVVAGVQIARNLVIKRGMEMIRFACMASLLGNSI